MNAANSGPSPSGDGRSLEHEGATMPGSVIINGSKIISGIAEILSLLGTLGEGYRLSCMYKCQVKYWLLLKKKKKIIFFDALCFHLFLVLQDALDVYLKLPHKHYNTGWVLSQVTFIVPKFLPGVCFVKMDSRLC